MTRNQYCPKCKKAVVGLYQNYVKPKRHYVRRAFYCKSCDIVLKDDEITYKKITFEKKEAS